MKHLEHITKDHIATYTILFKLKMALFYGITVLGLFGLAMSPRRASYRPKHAWMA